MFFLFWGKSNWTWINRNLDGQQESKILRIGYILKNEILFPMPLYLLPQALYQSIQPRFEQNLNKINGKNKIKLTK